MQLAASASTTPSSTPPSLTTGERLQQMRQLFPLTLRGVVIAGASAAACFHYGFGKLDLIFFGMGLVGLLVAVLSVVLTLIASVMLRRNLEEVQAPASIQVECDHWSETTFRLPNLWFIPFASIEWSWETPPSEVKLRDKDGTQREHIRPRRRAIANELVRHFEVGDVFGLCRITLVRKYPSDIQFIPSMGNLQHLHILRGLSAGDEISHPDGPPQGDRYDMRHYVPGDPIRFVLWKVFAKSRQLVIRTPEHAISRSRKTAVYMVAGDGDEASAGAARLAIEHSAFGGDWVFGADGTAQAAKTKQQALTALAASAAVKASAAGHGFAKFLESHVGQLGRAVVFIPAHQGPWLERVRAANATSNVKSIQFIVGIDSLDLTATTRLNKIYDQQGQRNASEGASSTLDDLATIADALGHQLLVVDRQQGMAWTAHQLQSLIAHHSKRQEVRS